MYLDGPSITHGNNYNRVMSQTDLGPIFLSETEQPAEPSLLLPKDWDLKSPYFFKRETSDGMILYMATPELKGSKVYLLPEGWDLYSGFNGVIKREFKKGEQIKPPKLKQIGYARINKVYPLDWVKPDDPWDKQLKAKQYVLKNPNNIFAVEIQLTKDSSYLYTPEKKKKVNLEQIGLTYKSLVDLLKDNFSGTIPGYKKLNIPLNNPNKTKDSIEISMFGNIQIAIETKHQTDPQYNLNLSYEELINECEKQATPLPEDYSKIEEKDLESLMRMNGFEKPKLPMSQEKAFLVEEIEEYQDVPDDAYCEYGNRLEEVLKKFKEEVINKNPDKRKSLELAQKEDKYLYENYKKQLEKYLQEMDKLKKNGFNVLWLGNNALLSTYPTTKTKETVTKVI